jgi:hypothetical protein
MINTINKKQLINIQTEINEAYNWGDNLFIYIDSKTKKLTYQCDKNAIKDEKTKLIMFNYNFNYDNYKNYVLDELINNTLINTEELRKNIVEISMSDVSVDLGSFFRKRFREHHRKAVLKYFNEYIKEYIEYKDCNVNNTLPIDTIL